MTTDFETQAETMVENARKHRRALAAKLSEPYKAGEYEKFTDMFVKTQALIEAGMKAALEENSLKPPGDMLVL